MCNITIDSLSPCDHFKLNATDLFDDSTKTMNHVSRHILHRVCSYGEASILIHQYKYTFLMNELLFMSNRPSNVTFLTPGGPLESKVSLGSTFVTGLETDFSPSLVNGIERIIPSSAIYRIKKECLSHNVSWHDDAFAKSAYLDDNPIRDINLLPPSAERWAMMLVSSYHAFSTKKMVIFGPINIYVLLYI